MNRLETLLDFMNPSYTATKIHKNLAPKFMQDFDLDRNKRSIGGSFWQILISIDDHRCGIFYFWMGPAHTHTPTLAEFLKSMFVTISCDQDSRDFADYYEQFCEGQNIREAQESYERGKEWIAKIIHIFGGEAIDKMIDADREDDDNSDYITTDKDED